MTRTEIEAAVRTARVEIKHGPRGMRGERNWHFMFWVNGDVYDVHERDEPFDEDHELWAIKPIWNACAHEMPAIRAALAALPREEWAWSEANEAFYGSNRNALFMSVPLENQDNPGGLWEHADCLYRHELTTLYMRHEA